MTARRRRCRSALRLLLPLSLASLAGARGLAAQGVAGMLFSYEAHAGERAEFDEGYRSHLEWHRTNRDPLPWYGWDVIAGRRLGQFVDGTFGIAFEALDRRVDPAGDAADASRTFAGHARATGRWAVRLRPELSTATPLEERSPPPLAQVITYALPPGLQSRFEEVLRRVRERAGEAELLPYTVYETVVGGPAAEVTVMVWRTGMAEFDREDRDPAGAIRRLLGDDLVASLRAESELWQLRSDLTLVPEAGGGAGDGAAGAAAEGGAARAAGSLRL